MTRCGIRSLSPSTRECWRLVAATGCIRSAARAGDRVHRRPCPDAGDLTRSSGRDGAELLHHGDAVELRPEVGHATVLEAVEVHALNPDRLAGGGDPHE